MGNLISFADPKYRVEKKDYWLTCGHYRLKGEQELLEDEITIDMECGSENGMFTSSSDGSPLLDNDAFIGLFDGHSGPHCAEFLADNLKSQIFKSPNYPENILKALPEAFMATDTEFLKLAKSKNLQDGSTALVLYISKNSDLFVGSVGDSSGYLYTTEGIIPLVDPVSSVARGMGSLYYKETKSELVADPVTNQHTLNANVEFILIGTWTFWQYVPYKEAVEYVIQKIAERKNSKNSREPYETYLSNVCLDLVSRANKKNTNENITCLLVVFEHKDSGGLFEIEV